MASHLDMNYGNYSNQIDSYIIKFIIIVTTVGNFTLDEFTCPTRLFCIGPYIALPRMAEQQVLTIWSSF